MQHFYVTNDQLSVGRVDLFGISSSSLFQIGDTEQINLYAMFDTPPESVIVKPLAPLPPIRDSHFTTESEEFHVE
ncbi:spore gernimation protein GerPD [Paenibacillus yanchengensis]|uniref:Spore gernimation protein GerPD n=1 Tax=Paenibacillus yanchengensis TaxID=2035833 RepID=A0ABW4YK80_9BACL